MASSAAVSTGRGTASARTMATVQATIRMAVMSRAVMIAVNIFFVLLPPLGAVFLSVSLTDKLTVLRSGCIVQHFKRFFNFRSNPRTPVEAPLRW